MHQTWQSRSVLTKRDSNLLGHFEAPYFKIPLLIPLRLVSVCSNGRIFRRDSTAKENQLTEKIALPRSQVPLLLLLLLLFFVVVFVFFRSTSSSSFQYLYSNRIKESSTLSLSVYYSCCRCKFTFAD